MKMTPGLPSHPPNSLYLFSSNVQHLMFLSNSR